MCSYNVSEKAGTVAVTVKRTGNLNQYAIVLCRTEQGTATSSSTAGSQPGKHDYVEHAGQVETSTHASIYVPWEIHASVKHQLCCVRYKSVLFKESYFIRPRSAGSVWRAWGHQSVYHHHQRWPGVWKYRELYGGVEHARVRSAGSGDPRESEHQWHRGRAHPAVWQKDLPHQREQRLHLCSNWEKRCTITLSSVICSVHSHLKS